MNRRPLRIPESRFPLTCQWEITCRCNLRCVMCYTDCYNTPAKIREELSTAEIFGILDALAAAGCLEITFTGGEPLARPDFFQIYERAKQLGFLVAIFTNATLMTPEAAGRLAQLPPLRVEISLHGITAETFEAVTQGKGSFERCRRAIELLLEHRIPLVLKTTALTLNRDEIFAIKKFVNGLQGASYRLGERLRLALDGGDPGAAYALAEEELTRLENEDPEICEAACEEKAEEGLPCTTGAYSFHIDAYGGLQLCSGNRTQTYDLRKGSFKEGFYQSLPMFPCRFKARPVPSISGEY